MDDIPKKVRRHDIDWLRVILFALLIPFHVGIGVYWGAYDFVQPEHEFEGEKNRDALVFILSKVDSPRKLLLLCRKYRF